MNEPAVPETLRATVSRDLSPVKPLSAPWRGALLAATVGLVVVAGASLLRPLRGDLAMLSPTLVWGSLILQLAVGALLIGLALRESIPGSGVAKRIALAALALGYLTHLAVALATWISVPSSPAGTLQCGVACMEHEVFFALPAFALVCLLILRALPMRAPMAGALAGAGTGLVADGGVHLFCPISSLGHVLVWHGGGFLAMVAVGLVLGLLWRQVQQ
jgi:hypothetical protein